MGSGIAAFTGSYTGRSGPAMWSSRSLFRLQGRQLPVVFVGDTSLVSTYGPVVVGIGTSKLDDEPRFLVANPRVHCDLSRPRHGLRRANRRLLQIHQATSNGCNTWHRPRVTRQRCPRQWLLQTKGRN